MKKKVDKDEVMKLVDLIHNTGISSEARTMAIGMLEKLTGRNILTKKDIFKIVEEYEDA